MTPPAAEKRRKQRSLVQWPGKQGEAVDSTIGIAGIMAGSSRSMLEKARQPNERPGKTRRSERIALHSDRRQRSNEYWKDRHGI